MPSFRLNSLHVCEVKQLILRQPKRQKANAKRKPQFNNANVTCHCLEATKFDWRKALQISRDNLAVKELLSSGKPRPMCHKVSFPIRYKAALLDTNVQNLRQHLCSGVELMENWPTQFDEGIARKQRQKTIFHGAPISAVCIGIEDYSVSNYLTFCELHVLRNLRQSECVQGHLKQCRTILPIFPPCSQWGRSD